MRKDEGIAEIGVIFYLLRHHDRRTAAGLLRDIGFEHVELDYRHADGLCHYHRADAKGVAERRELVESFGIISKAHCVGGLRQEDLPDLERVFEFAKGLGADGIVGVLDPDILPQLDDFCERYRVQYAIENHRGNVFQAAHAILQALEAHSLYIAANADTRHFASAGLKQVEEVGKLAGRICHVHLKDSDQSQPLGCGTADVPAVLAELKQQGYSQLLSIEHYEYRGIEGKTLRAGLAQALAYVKELNQAII